MKRELVLNFKRNRLKFFKLKGKFKIKIITKLLYVVLNQ